MFRRLFFALIWFPVLWGSVMGIEMLVATPLLEKENTTAPPRQEPLPKTGVEYVQQNYIGIGIYAGVVTLIGMLSGWLPGTAPSPKEFSYFDD
jgi:hypothetical protein